MMSNLTTLFGFGLFLVVWETMDLVCFSHTNSFWTTCIFAVFGSSLLVTSALALVSREMGSGGGDALTWKQTLRAILRNPSPSTFFYAVNALSGTAVLLLAIACLNSSTSLYFQKKVRGKSVVDFPIGGAGSPQSIIIEGTSIIDFYNAKGGTQGIVEYTHSSKKYCAVPIVALTYRKQDHSKFWVRCHISKKESCQDILSTKCAKVVDAPIYVGKRVGKGEERDFNEQLSDGGESPSQSILVDAHSPNLSLWGLLYYALNLLWLIPTSVALLYGNRYKSNSRKE